MLINLPFKILLLCFWQRRVTCNHFRMQCNIAVILVMLRDLNTVIDKVIFWQGHRLLRPAKNTNILGSVTLATLHTDKLKSFLAGRG